MTWISSNQLPLTVPVLPLDGHVLLPAASTPYRVSDPRLSALVSDLLERPLDQRWLAVPARSVDGARRTDAADERTPLVRSPWGFDTLADVGSDELGTLGLMTVATPLSGGDFIVVIEGRSACRLEPLPLTESEAAFAKAEASLGLGRGPREYRYARARHLIDRPESLLEARRQTTHLVQALFSLYDAFLLAATELPASEHGVDDAGLVYRIGAAVLEEPRARIELLAERCPAKRRQMVLQVIADQLSFAQREQLLGRPAPAC